MPRKPTILQSEFPYHVGARCINRDWFGMPIQEVWDIMSEQLFFCSHAFSADIKAFVLMSNHFHLILQTPKCNVSEFMAYFMRETSRSITKSTERINQTYGLRHFKCVLRGEFSYQNAIKYLYNNPVKAGICERPEQYPFSTLSGLMGFHRMIIPVKDDLLLLENLEETLEWLNTPIDENDWKAVRAALRKREFKLGKDRFYNKPRTIEL
jgi:putative transposase